METRRFAARWTATAAVVLSLVAVGHQAAAQGRGGGATHSTAGQSTQSSPPAAPISNGGRFTSTMKFVPPPPPAGRSSFPFASGFGRGPFTIGAFWLWGAGLWAAGPFSPAYGTAVGLEPPLTGAPLGGLQLDIDPRRAEVYVDGAYAGVVDEFSGYFHHLDLPAGPHAVAVVAPGYEPLIFNVIVAPGVTTTQRGTLARGYGH
jgi:PEGA domain-containing protein